MQTGYANNRKLFTLMVLVILMAILCACKFPQPSGDNKEEGTNISNEPTSTSIPVIHSECMEGIQPGKTTKPEVIELLGAPLDILSGSGFEILYYPSSIKVLLNSITIENDIVSLVSVNMSEAEAPAWSTILTQLGEPDHQTYSFFQQGAMTYIYAQKGLSFVANERIDLVFIQDCFVPSSLDYYMARWGTELPAENPYIK